MLRALPMASLSPGSRKRQLAGPVAGQADLFAISSTAARPTSGVAAFQGSVLKGDGGRQIGAGERRGS